MEARGDSSSERERDVGLKAFLARMGFFGRALAGPKESLMGAMESGGGGGLDDMVRGRQSFVRGRASAPG